MCVCKDGEHNGSLLDDSSIVGALGVIVALSMSFPVVMERTSRVLDCTEGSI